MRALVVSGCTAFWGGIIFAVVHAYPHPAAGLAGVFGVLSAYWWGALIVGVGTLVFIHVVADSAGRSAAGRCASRIAGPPEADLDTVLRFTRSPR